MTSNKAISFDYSTAFSRNIGWVTEAEQASLRKKRIAIAGMGGVGGFHLLTLARLGIGAFTISDFDSFELANCNRQAGAMLSTMGNPKVDVLANMAKDINPELKMQCFSDGINDTNIDDFLNDADLYVDGLDFFALKARRTVFQKCAEKGIPIITAAPLGMGVALINYLPGGMPLNQYFGFNEDTEEEQILRFMLGLSPAMLQRGYLVDPTTVDFIKHRGPSTPMACELCAGVAASTALKILLKRGKVLTAPWGQQFDPYLNKYVRTWRPGGHKNPIQKIGVAIAAKQLQKMTRALKR